MIHHGSSHIDHQDHPDRRSAQPLAPFTYIWGLELSVGAFVKYIWIWSAGWTVQAVFAGLAVLASFVVWRRLGRSSGNPPAPTEIRLGPTSRAFPAPTLSRLGRLALLIAAGTVVLAVLMHLLGGHPMIPAFATALVLAVGYVAASRRLGKPLLLLGLWLLALALVVAVFCPGLAGVMLDFFSGLSLIAAGSMIRLWSRS